MDLPDTNDSYASKTYWNNRYFNEDSFDWFVPYKNFRELILQTISVGDKILMLGCGNSLLSMEMYEDGFKNILNIDYSDIVIQKMKEKYAFLKDMEWQVMDIFNMSTLEGESFDVILEKGTLDALLVKERDPWSLSDEAEAMINNVLTQVSNLLKPSGRFISITFAQPHFRLPFYAQSKYCWNTTMKTIGSNFHYFFYVMIKGVTPSDEALNLHRNYVLRKQLKYSVVSLSESEDADYLLKGIEPEYDI